MASGQQAVILRQVERLFGRGAIAGMTEGKLLERFITARDEEAFEALIALHGPMVLGVCRRLLDDPNDIDDAFQATFVVLVRKAAGLRDRSLLGPWLHGVARRVALRARSESARRRAREKPNEGEDAVAHSHDADRLELREVIDDEVSRLPEKLRWPVILCHLEGRTYEEAAEQLRWTAATVRGRLVQARERLRGRLLRRGFEPSILLPMFENGLPFEPPTLAADLIASTISAASGVALGKSAAAGATSAVVTTLASEVARGLSVSRLLSVGLFTAFVVLVGASVAAGVKWLNAPPQRLMAAAPTEPTKNKDAIAAEADKKVAATTPRRLPPGSDAAREVHEVTITGQARDASGNPVAGATIQVINANLSRMYNEGEVWGRTTTRPDGRFVLERVPVVVITPQPGPIPKPTEGAFELSGWTPGHSFTWHERQSYRPVPRPANPKAEEAGRVFYERQPIESNFVFGPPVRLRGRIVDDQGRPIAGAKIQVGFNDSVRNPEGSGMWNCLAINPIGGEETQFNGIRYLPEARRSARSDAQGNYVIEGLPREAKLLTLIDYQPSYEPLQITIATTSKPLEGIQSVGYDGVLDHRFVSPRNVHVHVIRAGDERPVPNVVVIAEGTRMLRDGASGKTDQRGNATLRLLPDSYTIRAEPPRDAPYIVAKRSLKVANDPREQTADITLDRGAVVTFEATDSDTGVPVSGIGALYDTDSNREQKEVHSQTVFVDHPVTGIDGKLTVVMPPGVRRFFPVVRTYGFLPVTTASDLFTLTALKPTTVRFSLRKRPDARAEAKRSATDVVSQRLENAWNSQRSLMSRGRLKVRRYDLDSDSFSSSLVRKLLDSLDPERVPDLIERLAMAFPESQRPTPSHIELSFDGPRRRQLFSMVMKNNELKLDHITVDNGKETAQLGVSNAQADITDHSPKSRVRYGTYDIESFCVLPRLPGRLSSPSGSQLTAERKLTVEFKNSSLSERYSAEATTGFIYRASSTYADQHGTEHWQFAPRTVSEGLTVPGMSVEMRFSADKVIVLWINVLESIDVATPIPPEAFVLSVPPGTLILDYRQGDDDKYRGVTRAPVSDIIAEADRIAARKSPYVSPIKLGQPAPPINPAVWLDRSGKVAAPTLGGKIVLVDFWGITCGPCVAELPQVREAVEHFADTDLIIIGLHDSGGTVTDVTDFAKKRSLTYPLAIDHPAKEPGWFGATFAAYGVRGIPGSAVIDRAGKVVFVGRFPQAVEKAAALLKDAPAGKK